MKKWFILLFAVLVIAGGSAWYVSSDTYREAQFLKELATKDEKLRIQVGQLMDSARNWEAQMDASTTTLAYAEAARYWKTIGDSTVQTLSHHRYARQRAAAIYEKALEKFGDTNAQLFSNAADVYLSLQKYEKAEEYYQRALALEPGNAGFYKKLADLYQYSLKKSPAEVLAVYDRALQRLVVGAVDILKNRAVYYESIDKRKEALVDWAKVYALEPDNTAAKQEYERLYQALEADGVELEDPTVSSSTTPSDAR